MGLDGALLKHLYNYDRTLDLLATREHEPLFNLVGGKFVPIAGLARERVSFGSTHDQRVVATLTYPVRGGPFPAVILQHGSSPLGRHSWQRWPIDMQWPQRHGFMTVAIDAPGFGSRETPDDRGRLRRDRPDLMFRTRDQRIQNVQDLMRTADYLATRDDVQLEAIAFCGISMGTRVGVPFFALDGRVRTAAFFIGGSGPYSGFDVEGTRFAELVEDERMIFEMTDPITFAPMTAGRSIYVANGTQDTVVGPGAGERLQEAFGEPKTLRWFEGDHAEVPMALFDEAGEFISRALAQPA